MRERRGLVLLFKEKIEMTFDEKIIWTMVVLALFQFGIMAGQSNERKNTEEWFGKDQLCEMNLSICLDANEQIREENVY